MANQSNLKAWVRYDGTGTVVTAGPIFQANKPKVGNWRQINSSLCCNPSSTTTTTTAGGVTPTAFVKGYWLSVNDACNTTLEGELVIYSASSTFGPGISVFTDAALTIPVTEGYVFSPGMMNPNLVVGVGGVLSTFECPPSQESAIGNFIANDACAGIGSPMTVYYNGSLGNGTALFLDAGLTVPYSAGSFPSGNGTYLRIYFQAAYQVCTMSGNIIFDYLPC